MKSISKKFGAVVATIFLGLLPLFASAQEIVLPDCSIEWDTAWCPIMCPPEAYEAEPPFYCPATSPYRHPILIVPGLVASHNKQRILKDQPGGTWKFTPSVDWFDPLIKRLGEEGYQLNKDLFIVHYDWRQGNDQSATEYLAPVIANAKAINNASKVEIIAHSMGGLVARSYIQSDNYQNDVDQLIMLGTPNAGAADAYDIWEGGVFPDRWGIGEKYWIKRIESSLKRIRHLDLERPLSFRSFFPSLKQLLPIDAFVKKDGENIGVNQLTDKNTFLGALRDSKNLLTDRGVRVTTIAGTDKQTLDKVSITSARDAEDMARERWRDGHANPDPPAADSFAGDQTVLKSSVGDVGDEKITIPNTTHEELPGKAQDIIVEKLVANPQGDFVPSRLATSALGVDVLSPVLPTIHGPHGEVLSATENTFPADVKTDFDYDPESPDDIKMVTIINPPPGTYTVDLTGTGTGDYHVITTYADSDETRASERAGTTNAGKQETYTVAVTPEGSFISPATDVLEMARRLRDTLTTLGQQGKLPKRALQPLQQRAETILRVADNYQQTAAQRGVDHAQSKAFSRDLKQQVSIFAQQLGSFATQGAVTGTALQELSALRDAFTDAGL